MTSFYLSKPYTPPRAPKNLPLDQPWALLGNISPQQFMKTYWHKKPLLVRGAIPAFTLAKEENTHLSSPISADELFAIAGQEIAETRLIASKPWSFIEGPFKKKAIPTLKDRNWTLLLQGMEARHQAAADVLSWFRFIPDARLDDLMISIAGIGGGVGPHFDSYDVFLIQMSGRRQWRISAQEDLSLNSKLPLKILQRFEPQEEWILEPGDMLYLPPHIAHDGIALDGGCQTWSVGFRAPTYRELLREGLWRLAESLDDIPNLSSRYSDPKQAASLHPEQLPGLLIEQLQNSLVSLKLDQVGTFLPGIASYLSEPKPQAFFDSPHPHLTVNEFARNLGKRVLIPHPQTRILSQGSQVFCNGDEVTRGQPPATAAAWRTLSKDKVLDPRATSTKLEESDSLFQAYMAGWIIFEA
jgi:50S ribosomal protein L16 3-hydroxylase